MIWDTNVKNAAVTKALPLLDLYIDGGWTTKATQRERMTWNGKQVQVFVDPIQNLPTKPKNAFPSKRTSYFSIPSHRLLVDLRKSS